MVCFLTVTSLKTSEKYVIIKKILTDWRIDI